MLQQPRNSLLLAIAVLWAGAFGGCSTSPVLPPPVSGPGLGQPAPGYGNAGRRPTSGIVTSIPTPGRNPWQPTAPARNWKYIVVHHTATASGSVESIHESHLKNKDKAGNPWLGIGYHFVIGNGVGMSDGEIEPTFRWRTQIQGAHAGSNDKVYNEQGIGICLVGNFEKTPPTAAQRRAIKLLVQTLKSEYGIPGGNVVGHNQIRASSTECPGKYFNMSDVAFDAAPEFLGFDDRSVPVEQVSFQSGSTLK